MTRIIKHLSISAFDNTPTIWCEGVGEKAISAGPYRVNESDYNEEIHGARVTPGKAEKAIDALPPVTANTLQGLPEGVTSVPLAPSAVNATSPATQPVGPTNPSPNQVYVVAKGKKFFVIDGAGNDVEHQAISAKGYGTDAEAWQAVMSMQDFKPEPIQVQIADPAKA